MKVLIINKFLHPNGGSETYIFNLGTLLQEHGHEVQYFGMEHENRAVGNEANAYTSNMDFHSGSMLSKLTYPLKTIYSAEARKKIRAVLEDFQPEVCHLNNFNYQLTPSIILEIRKWEKEGRDKGRKVKIIFTAHDFQLLCPNHMLYNPNTEEICEKCICGDFSHCYKNKCIHGSKAKSLIGAMEGAYWKRKQVYRQIDRIICCSEFMKEKMDENPIFAEKTVAMHNFLEVEELEAEDRQPESHNSNSKPHNSKLPGSDSTGPNSNTNEIDPYILYFGRFSKEKGVETLLSACEELRTEHPEIHFMFAGSGPLKKRLSLRKNVTDVGFKTKEELAELIGNARFTVYPSEWYENCPYSVMESIMYQTPVLGANIGGIPELIEGGVTGELFESGNTKALKTAILDSWEKYADTKIGEKQGERFAKEHSPETYYEALMEIYRK